MKNFFWQSSFRQNIIIAALLMALLNGIFLPSLESTPELALAMAFLGFGLLCGSLAGLRTHLGARPLRRILGRECLYAIAMSLATLLIAAGVLAVAGKLALLQKSMFLPVPTLLLAALSGPAYLAAQIFGWLWRWWAGLRERRFVWALTHAQLSIVALLGALVLVIGLGVITYFVVSDLNRLTSIPPEPTYSVFVRVVVWVLMLVFFTVGVMGLGVLVLLPPAVLFSYRVARGITRRLEALAAVTNQMRAGDLNARVPVEGADELAQLQVNFNAMVGDLQRHEAELELRQRELSAERDRFENLLRAHRELVANVSHELRTPVGTLSGSLDLALNRWDEQPLEVLYHDLQVMSGEVERLNQRIDDLFTLSRAEVERLSLHLQPVEPAALLGRLVDAVEKVAWQTRRVEVLFEPCGDLPPVQADPNRLEQIIRNLLQNGLRHTGPGGFVAISARQNGERLRIEVADSGQGIAPEDLPHLWERFYRSPSADEMGEGAGLGLALVKELTEAMQGEVGVQSCLGEGSTFWIELPTATGSAVATRM